MEQVSAFFPGLEIVDRFVVLSSVAAVVVGSLWSRFQHFSLFFFLFRLDTFEDVMFRFL